MESKPALRDNLKHGQESIASGISQIGIGNHGGIGAQFMRIERAERWGEEAPAEYRADDHG
jgi:hypothetical protein